MLTQFQLRTRTKIVGVSAAVCIICVVCLVFLPAYRQAAFVRWLESAHGSATISPAIPAFARKCLGKSWDDCFGTITEVDVAHMVIPARQWEYLANLPHLRIVRVTTTSIQTESLFPADYSGEIEFLCLGFSGDSHLTDKQIRSLAHLPKLESLAIRVTDDRAFFAILPKLHHLKTLDLSYSHISEQCMRIVAKMPALTTLYLANSDFDDTKAAPLAGMTQLERLDLSNTVVTDKCLEYISNLHLRSLNIDHTQITNAAELEYFLNTHRVGEHKLSP